MLKCEWTTSGLIENADGTFRFLGDIPCGYEGFLCDPCAYNERWRIDGYICYLCDKEWKHEPDGFWIPSETPHRGWIAGACWGCQQQAEARRTHYGTWEHERMLLEFERQGV